jgi:quercetin dioxygenase-like cupin family protein
LFTSLATPSSGSLDVAVWEVRLTPGHPATPHRLTHHEVFVATAGRAIATLDGRTHEVVAGDCLVVPPDTDLTLEPADAEGFTALCLLPAGGKAVIGDGEPFTPPWAV